MKLKRESTNFFHQLQFKKSEIKVKAEIDEEKRNLFEREKFIESSKSIRELFENHFLVHVQSAK